MAKTPASKSAKPEAAAPSAAIIDPQAQLTKYLAANRADHFNLEKSPDSHVLSSGSLALDIEGIVFPPGVYRCCGGPNLGKTPFLINLMDELLDTVPNSRVVWALAEGRLSSQNTLRFRHKVVYTAEEWEVGTVFVFKTNTFETWINLKRDLVTNNPTGCRYGFVTDSIDNMILKADMAKEFSEADKVAGTPAMSKRLFQKMGLAMRERGHWSFFVSQRTSAIKLDPYSKAEPRQADGSGGNSLAHNSDEVLEFQEWYESDLILKDPDERLNRVTNPALGHKLKIKLKKSNTEKRFLIIEVPIKHGITSGSAIWREREVGDMLLAWQLVKKAGSWLSFSEALLSELRDANIATGIPDKVQGMNQLYALLEERKDVTDYLYAKFKAMAGGSAA